MVMILGEPNDVKFVLLVTPPMSGGTAMAFDDLGLKLPVLSRVLICKIGAQTQIQLLFGPLPIRFGVVLPTHFPGPRNGTLWIGKLLGIRRQRDQGA